MNQDEHQTTGSAYRIAESTHIGYVHLRVRDLDHSLSFYLDVMGFRLVSGGPHTATLSATGRGPGLIVLTEKKDAPARPPRTTGLYHMAIRVPSRRALAQMIAHLEEAKWIVDGYADHDVSEAVYFADPDGNGIEVYSDRPRDEWPLRGGQVEMITVPLDIDNLMRELSDWPSPWEGIDPNTVIGHIHLRVSNLEVAESFYRGVLGFDVTQRDMVGALFMSAGGYHHHIGINVWSSEGGTRPPADALGLISFSLVLPDETARRTLEARLAAAGSPARSDAEGGLRTADPDSNFIELTVR